MGRRVVIGPFPPPCAGRILSRFSRDLDVIDLTLAPTLASLLASVVNVAGSAVAILITTKGLYALMLAPLCTVYYRVQRYFRRSSLELQRLYSISRSPLYASFSQTLHGVSTIRAFAQQQRFIRENDAAFDRHNIAGASMRNARSRRERVSAPHTLHCLSPSLLAPLRRTQACSATSATSGWRCASTPLARWLAAALRRLRCSRRSS